DESGIQSFWNSAPCGDHIVGWLHGAFADDYRRFCTVYDTWRYLQERHIPTCQDQIDWHSKKVLEIELGKGVEPEQIIRQGARWSGLDLQQESVNRGGVRLAIPVLQYGDLQKGSAVAKPWAGDGSDFGFRVVRRAVRAAAYPLRRSKLLDRIPVRRLWAERRLSWHLWVHLRARTGPIEQTALPACADEAGSP
ncbi:MAG: hypothetical protein ACREQ5_19840, partial [Candidatus Dormibacteria bacterium]